MLFPLTRSQTPLLTLLLTYTYTQVGAIIYDFVIIGGGTSGLVIANRLSEWNNISIAVIEAGDSVRNNTNVTSVDAFTLALNTDIDWQYESTNQTFAGGKRLEYPAGKALGGTSTINGMTYTRAPASQIDSWEKVGNSGWNWSSLFPYYKKSEAFLFPTAAQISSGASFIRSAHGTHGPLKTGYAYDLSNGTIQASVRAAWEALGVKWNRDINDGSMSGYTVAQSTLDRDENVREDAARAYYYPIQERENLHVFLNTNARRIVWMNGTTVAARGVEVLMSDGTVDVIEARREVIVCAGSLRSPSILEHSGIGNPNILLQSNIPLKIPLPGVGENLQDQPNNALLYTGPSIYNGTVPFVTYVPLSSIIPHPSPANITKWAHLISNLTNHSIPASAISHRLEIQNELITQQQIANAEIILGNTVTVGQGPSNALFSAFWVLNPFSRGSIHVVDEDPIVYPAINPNFFAVEWDLKVQVEIGRYAREFWGQEALGSLFQEASPGFDVLPLNATDEQWEEWIKNTYSSNSHPVGTCAMMSRELGGVVNSEMRVYGTGNVRVVDASIWPFQVSGHLTSTVYAVAERAADIIKGSIML